MQDDDLRAMVREELPGVRLLYLFGSTSGATARPDSDVDIAVLLAAPLASETRFAVQERLATRLHRDVDLVDLRRCSTVLRAQIVETGRILFETDASERARFEMTALSAYARLNEERRGILTDIRARGSVYG